MYVVFEYFCKDAPEESYFWSKFDSEEEALQKYQERIDQQNWKKQKKCSEVFQTRHAEISILRRAKLDKEFPRYLCYGESKLLLKSK